MPQYTYPMGADGPVVPVMVGLDAQAAAALVSAGLPVLAPMHSAGLVDSGSNITVIAPHLLYAHQAVPISTGQSTTVGGQAAARLHTISLSIIPPPGTVGPLLTHPTLLVMEMPASLDVGVIIGRDVLARYEIHLDGPRGELRILF